MDMGSLLRTILGTIINYKKDPYVHYQGSLSKPDVDRSPSKPPHSVGLQLFFHCRSLGLHRGVMFWNSTRDDVGPVGKGVRISVQMGLGFRVYGSRFQVPGDSFWGNGKRFQVLGDHSWLHRKENGNCYLMLFLGSLRKCQHLQEPCTSLNFLFEL